MMIVYYNINMKKIILAIALLASFGAMAQNTTTITSEKGEKWWGAITAMGSKTPFESNTPRYSLAKQNFNNQTTSFLISNLGRYIWSEKPFDFEFRDGNILIDSPSPGIEVVKAGKNIREAFILARNKHFKGSETMPPVEFFAKPQYNTWIELLYNQNQVDIEKYANDIISNGFPPGVLMIDDNWQRYYGNFDFKAERFQDPRAMISRLHGQGFKVMLWVSPFVSPDSPEARELASKGYLVKEKGSKSPAIIRWWNGSSYCYDLTNPEAFKYLTEQLKKLQAEYGVDGFKLDAGDPGFYDIAKQDYFNENAISTDHTQKWAELGQQFQYNEFRACFGMQGQALVQRLGDKNYSWQALELLVPEMLNAGLMGYSFTCPDMIGGGQYGSFINVKDFDQSLIVRSAQVHAMMPMMQFSVAPWRVLDAEHLKYCLEAAKLHEKMAPYIIELAQESARTGEPIVRSMEYMYPKGGFSDCKDQFMLGSHYLVAPVTSSDGKRTIRLPRGTWIDDLGVKHRGPLVMQINVPLGRLPYFEFKR